MNELSPIGYFVTVCLALFGARYLFVLITDFGFQWRLTKRRANDAVLQAQHSYWRVQEYGDFILGVLVILVLVVLGLGGAAYIMFG